MPRPHRWPIVAACVLGLPLLYWWSLGPVAYLAARCNSTTVWRLAHLYGAPSGALANRWRWYKVVIVNRQTEWARSGAWEAIDGGNADP